MSHQDCKHTNLTPYYFNGVEGVAGFICNDCSSEVDPFKDVLKSVQKSLEESRKRPRGLEAIFGENYETTK